MRYVSFLDVVLIAGTMVWIQGQQAGDPLAEGFRLVDVASVVDASE